MKKFVKKLILLFISIQFAACEGNLEPHLYGVVDTGNAFSTPADLSAATVFRACNISANNEAQLLL